MARQEADCAPSSHLWVHGVHGGDAAALKNRGQKGAFIGYKEGSKGYRVYDPVEGHVHVSCDVVFDESTFWSWDDDGNM
jgi:hypothetical protein